MSVSVAEFVEAPSIVPSTSTGPVHNVIKKKLLPFAFRLKTFLIFDNKYFI